MEAGEGMKKCRGVVWGCLLGLFLTVSFFSGCERSKKAGEWTDNGLAIEKNGQVVYCVVDSFDKGFYDINELTGMAVEEAALFNGKNRVGEETPVTVEEVAQIGGDSNRVRVVYRFDKTESYEKFQGEILYFETLESSIQQKHIFSGAVLMDGAGTVTLDEKTVSKLTGKHVVVTTARNTIKLPYDVLYCSEGVRILEDGRVSTADCTDTAIIVMKK